jgi:hypothetical protein
MSLCELWCNYLIVSGGERAFLGRKSHLLNIESFTKPKIEPITNVDQIFSINESKGKKAVFFTCINNEIENVEIRFIGADGETYTRVLSDSEYYSQIQPYYHSDKMPDKGYYMYSYALNLSLNTANGSSSEVTFLKVKFRYRRENSYFVSTSLCHRVFSIENGFIFRLF